MNTTRAILRRQASRIVAIVLIASSFGLARLPATSRGEQSRLAARFRFASEPMPAPDEPAPRRTVREVHPSYRGISAWISAVGAAIALHDLDGNGLPDDSILVDTGTDRVIVAPVPGTEARYRPFTLDPSPLPYDPATMAPMGSLPGDFNEDGLRDVLVYYWGRTPMLFLRTPDDASDSALSAARFDRVELVPGGGRWFTNAATSADLDGDGHLDLVVGNYFPDDARVLDAGAVGVSPMQHSMSRALNGGRKHLLLWSGAEPGSPASARFREADGVLTEELSCGWTLAIGAADLDGDLLPEIYLANDFGPDRLLHNRSTPGSPRFAAVEGRRTLGVPSSKVLGRDSFKGMGVDFGDLDGDGRLDFLVSNIAAEYMLEESHFAFVSTGHPDLFRRGVAPYEDRAEPLGLARSGWGWDVKLADFDNDGRLEAVQALGFLKGKVNRWPELQELAMGNDEFLSDPRNWPRFQPGDDLSGRQRNVFATRDPSGRFRDIAGELGLDEPGVSRGIAVADVDGDGRLDFAVANQWAGSSFHRNASPVPGAFLGLHLLLPAPGEASTGPCRVSAGHPPRGGKSRPAVGASVRVRLEDGRVLVAQVDGGNGHSGKRSPDLHFGLGREPGPSTLAVELTWRDLEGKVRGETVQLGPGWHTIVLASGG